MARERIQTRADEDTVKAVAKYQESDDTPELTQAEAVRRLVRAGLAVKGYPVAGHSDLDALNEIADDSDVIVGRARQAGTVVSVVVTGVITLSLVLIMQYVVGMI